MTDGSSIPEQAELQSLPDCPEAALLLAGAFQRLGGRFEIGGCFARGISRPFSSNSLPDGRPQFPDARPHEQFQSDSEWRGAVKLVDYFVSRLSDRDKDFVFLLCGHVIANNRQPFDFREQMQ